MKANTLISKHILPLSLSDHIDTALEKMIEFKVLQLYVLLPYYGLEISQLHLSRFLYHFPVGISL